MSGELTTFPDLEQGTDEWLEARRGILTASTIGALITPKTIKAAANETARALINQLIAERITGRVEPVFVSDDMLRGQMDEPRARDMYAELRGVEVQQIGFMTLDLGSVVVGYSPDGLVNSDGLIEVKSRKPKKHIEHVRAGVVPPENMAQIQTGLLVSGRDWCDYISICGGLPLWVTRVEPDELWQQAIIEAATAAEQDIEAGIAAFEAATKDMPVPDVLPGFGREDIVI